MIFRELGAAYEVVSCGESMCARRQELSRLMDARFMVPGVVVFVRLDVTFKTAATETIMSRELAYEVLGHLAFIPESLVRCPSTSLFVSKKYCHASFDTEGDTYFIPLCCTCRTASHRSRSRSGSDRCK